MSAKRVVKHSIDWAKFAQKVPKNQMGQYNTFKAKSDGYTMKVAALPESLPAINWAVYESSIAVPGMVEQFKKQYEALDVAYPKDTFSAAVDAAAKAQEGPVAEFIAERQKEIADFTAEHAKWQAQLPLSEMMMDEYWQAFPEDSIDTFNNPTMWPHLPEYQPENIEKWLADGTLEDEEAH